MSRNPFEIAPLALDRHERLENIQIELASWICFRVIREEAEDERVCRSRYDGAAEGPVIEVWVLLNRFLPTLCSELGEDIDIIVCSLVVRLQIDEALELVDDQIGVATILV